MPGNPESESSTVATWLLQSLTPLGVDFPFSLSPERFIVSSPTPCIACATQMTVKSVGSEEELGCGIVSEGGVRNKGRHLGKQNHEKSGEGLE